MYRYDSNNKVLEECAYSIDGKQLRTQTMYEYDEKGNLKSSSSKSLRENYVWRKDIYTYDESGRLASHTNYSYKQDGSNDGKTITCYNEYGDIASKESFWSNMEVRSLLSCYEYDTYGSVVAEKKYDEEDKLFKDLKYTITYDEHGNRLTYEQQQHIDEYSYYILGQRKYNITYR